MNIKEELIPFMSNIGEDANVPAGVSLGNQREVKYEYNEKPKEKLEARIENLEERIKNLEEILEDELEISVIHSENKS